MNFLVQGGGAGILPKLTPIDLRLPKVIPINLEHSSNKQIHENKCEQCGKVFAFRNSLIKHIKVIHEGLKNYVCQICNKAFSHKNHLKGHIEAIHEGKEGVYNYKCKYCERGFMRSSGLTMHVKNSHNTVFLFLKAKNGRYSNF